MRYLSPRIASLNSRLAIASAEWHTRHLSETPRLVIDLSQIRADVRRWKAALADPELGDVDIYAAIKACPHPLVAQLLAAEDCGLDAASFGEVKLGLLNHHPASRLIFGNPVKLNRHIQAAYLCGVRVFALDRWSELDKLAKYAPGAQVYVRLAIGDDGPDIVGSMGKFGCDEDTAVELLQAIRERGLVPYGLSFHVGSQTRTPALYAEAIAACGRVMKRLLELDNPIHLHLINIGGGFPAYSPNSSNLPSPEEFGRAIRKARRTNLPDTETVRFIAEPGRSLFAQSGSIDDLEVIGVTRTPSGLFQVVVNNSAFDKFMETLESGGQQAALGIQFTGPHGAALREPTWISGQTCDTQDSVGLNVPLSPHIRVGDRLRVTGIGAYSFAYESRGFNGFKSADVVCINP